MNEQNGIRLSSLNVICSEGRAADDLWFRHIFSVSGKLTIKSIKLSPIYTYNGRPAHNSICANTKKMLQVFFCLSLPSSSIRSFPIYIVSYEKAHQRQRLTVDFRQWVWTICMWIVETDTKAFQPWLPPWMLRHSWKKSKSKFVGKSTIKAMEWMNNPAVGGIAHVVHIEYI